LFIFWKSIVFHQPPTHAPWNGQAPYKKSHSIRSASFV
jgi:hypothetical protein